MGIRWRRLRAILAAPFTRPGPRRLKAKPETGAPTPATPETWRAYVQARDPSWFDAEVPGRPHPVDTAPQEAPAPRRRSEDRDVPGPASSPEQEAGTRVRVKARRASKDSSPTASREPAHPGAVEVAPPAVHPVPTDDRSGSTATQAASPSRRPPATPGPGAFQQPTEQTPRPQSPAPDTAAPLPRPTPRPRPVAHDAARQSHETPGRGAGNPTSPVSASRPVSTGPSTSPFPGAGTRHGGQSPHDDHPGPAEAPAAFGPDPLVMADPLRPDSAPRPVVGDRPAPEAPGTTTARFPPTGAPPTDPWPELPRAADRAPSGLAVRAWAGAGDALRAEQRGV